MNDSEKQTTILAIDDEQDFLELMQEMLTSFRPDFNVLTASSGGKGVEIAKKNQPDVILLDIKMPRLDGYEVCRRLKTDPKTKAIPIIFLSGLALGPEERTKGLKLGVDAFLGKPFNESELMAQVDSMLRLKQAEDDLQHEKEQLEQRVLERTEELEESQLKYQDLYDLAPDMFASVDVTNKKIIECNQTLADKLGYSKEELVGMQIPEIYHPDCHEEWRNAFKNFVKTGEVHDVELIAVSKDGLKIDVSLSASAIRDDKGKVRYSRSVLRDISERKQLERNLAESQSMREAIVMNVPGMIYRAFPDWSAEIISNSEEICGYRPEEINAMEKNWLDLIHADDVEEVSSKGAVLTQQATEAVQYYRIVHKNGNIRWVEDRKASYFDDDGNFGGINGVVYDITKRIEFEEQLSLSEDKYRAIVESIDEGLFEVDLEGTLTFVNPELCRITGYSEDQLIGQNNRDYTTPETAKEMLETFNQIYLTGEPAHMVEFNVINKSGDILVLELSASLIRDAEEQPVGFRGIVRDMTERRAMEQYLMESEERFRNAFELAAIGRAIANNNGQFLMVNKAFCDMVGFEEGDLLEKSWMELTHPDDLPGSIEYAQKMGQGEISHFRYEHRLLHKSGEHIWIDLNVVQLRDQDGQPQYVIGDIVNLTEEKKAAAEIERSHQLIRQERNMFISGPVVVFRWRPRADDAALYVSKNVEEVLGYKPDDITSGKVKYRDIIHPEDWDQVSSEVRKYSEAGEESFEQTPYRLVCKDGSVIWVADYTTVIRNKQGEVEQYFGYIFDITTTIKVQEVLKETNRELSMLAKTVENMNECVSITDRNHQLIFINQAFENTYGFSKDELLGKTTDFLRAPTQEDKSGIMREQNQYGGWKGELLNVRKGGEVFPIELSTRPLIDADEEITGYIGISSDITERKLAEKALRDSEGKYRLLFENMMNGFALHEVEVDEEGKPKDYIYLEANAAFGELTGLKHKEIIGKRVTELIPGIEKDPADWIGTFGGVALGGGEKRLEQYSDALDKWWSVLVFSPRANQFATIFEDVTERVQAERKLSDSAEKIRAINEASQVLASSLNVESVVEHCATLAGELFEADDVTLFMLEEDLVTLKPMICIGEYVDEIMALRLQLGEGFTGKVAQEGVAKIINRIDLTDVGKQVPGTPQEPESLMAAPLKIKDEVMGVMTLSKLGEEEFEDTDLNFLSNLADISSVSIHNAQLYEDAVNAEQVKSLFLANMSHEIRTPLNSILGFTELIENTVSDRISEDEQEYFRIIRTSGNRLMHTVHEILDLSQIEAGTVELQPQLLDLNSLVEGVVAQYRQEAADKTLSLEFLSELDHATVRIDEASITTAISNLVDNAIKYTEKGGVAVRIDLRDDHYELAISDTGIGISKEYQEKMYDVFSQESTGYTKKYQGVGLGLAITKRSLDLNGVTLSLRSEEGRSTTFILGFEIHDEMAKVAAQEATAEETVDVEESVPEEVHRPVILVVEDDPNSQRLMHYFLKSSFETCFAASVAEAREVLADQAVELILLDLSLAGDEDGLVLSRELRQDEKWKDLPIIAVTAHAFTSDREKVLEEGCDDFLGKPVNHAQLMEKINNFLGED